jgi:DNA-binding NarL/FixJ family response regulator
LQYAGQLLVNKNKTLLQLRGLLNENNHANASTLRTDIARMIEGIEKDIKADGANDDMLSQTSQADDAFIHKLQEQFPNLTKNDIRLCSYIKLGFSSAEIATFLNITESSVEVRRSRLRAKLNIPKGMEFLTFLETTA